MGGPYDPVILYNTVPGSAHQIFTGMHLCFPSLPGTVNLDAHLGLALSSRDEGSGP